MVFTMSEPPVVKELNSPLARELGELQLIAKDIETSYRAIDIWRAQYAPLKNMSRDQQTISLALMRDAIVQFVGCFDKNSEYSLRKEAVYSTDDQLAYFKWLRDLRDSYAAHSFGPYRQCVVGINMSAPSRRIHFIDQIYRGPHTGEQLLEFIAIAGTYSANRMLELIEKLLRSLDAVTDEELNALPVARTHSVDQTEVRMSRKAFLRNRPKKSGQ